MTVLVVVAGLAAMLWIFSTMPQGRRLLARLGVRTKRGGGAPRDDREYLLRVCDGDPAKVARLLELEREAWPEISEAQAYRRAIRRYLRDR